MPPKSRQDAFSGAFPGEGERSGGGFGFARLTAFFKIMMISLALAIIFGIILNSATSCVDRLSMRADEWARVIEGRHE